MLSRPNVLDEVQRDVISISDTSSIDPTHEGKMVHLSGVASTEDVLEDSTFGLTQSGIIKLKREVKMYQWVESKKQQTKQNSGGSSTTQTTYSYNQE